MKKVAALGHKKQRDLHRLFLAEGTKSVLDVAGVIKPEAVYATAEWINENKEVPFDVEEINGIELQKISQQKNAQGVLAIFPIQKPSNAIERIGEGLILALDDVRDPGNMGTIIRLADWFGINMIVCSKGCTDIYNPKVVQATMGSIARVEVIYTDLVSFLKETALPVYGTFMDGEDIYQSSLPESAIVVMGNEGKGISPEIEMILDCKITIPSFSQHKQSAESLNVSTATAIICSEFRRR